MKKLEIIVAQLVLIGSILAIAEGIEKENLALGYAGIAGYFATLTYPFYRDKLIEKIRRKWH